MSKKIVKLFSGIAAALLLVAGCGANGTNADLKKAVLVTDKGGANDKSFNQEEQTDEYFSKYFRPWKQSKLSYSEIEAKWGFSYKNKKVYLENHNQATKEWFYKKIENANFENYNKDIKKGFDLVVQQNREYLKRG